MEHTGFPSDETLAAFLDGRLDADTRRKVVEHMTECDECYSVVAGGGEVIRRDHAPQTGNSDRPAMDSNWYGIGAAAAVLLLVFGGLFLNKFGSKTGEKDLLAAANVSTYRSTETRIKNLTFRPLPRPKRGNADSAEGPSYRLLAAAGYVQERATGSKDPAILHRAGIAALLVNDWIRSADLLRQSTQIATHRDDLRDAIHASDDFELLSDLSAASYELYRRSKSAADLRTATEAIQRAWRVQQTAEVVWNRALVLQQSSAKELAISAWRDYVTRDPGSTWAVEANQRLSELDTQSLFDRWIELRQQLLKHPQAPADVVGAAARETTRSCAAFVEQELLPGWGESFNHGDEPAARRQLDLATALAGALQRAHGDSFLADVVAVIARAHGSQKGLAALAEAHSLFGRARKQYAGHDIAPALADYKAAEALFAANASPFALLAARERIACLFMQNKYDEAAHEVEVVQRLVTAAPATYHTVRARTTYLQGLLDLQRGRPDEALRRYHNALAEYQSVGEDDSAALVEGRVADVLDRMGDLAEASARRNVSLQALDKFGDPSLRNPVLYDAAHAALTQGWFLTAEILLQPLSTSPDAMWRCASMTTLASCKALSEGAASAKETLRAAQTACREIPDAAVRDRLSANTPILQAGMVATSEDASTGRLQKSVDFFSATNNTVWLPEAYRLLGNEYRHAGANALAEQSYRKGFAAAQVISSSLTMPSQRASIDETIHLLVERLVELVSVRNETEALEILDASRSRELVLVSSAQTQSLAGLSAKLNPEAAFVEFAWTPSGMLAWTLSSRGLTMTRLEGFSLSAIPFKSCTADPEHCEVSARRSLYDSVVRPWEPSLPVSCRRLVISQARELANLPMAALLDSISHETLVEKYELSYSPSIAVALVNSERYRERSNSAGTVLLVSGSGFDHARFPALMEIAFVDQEIAEISRMYPEAIVLGDKNATKANMRKALASAKIMSFAGHAIAGSSSTTPHAALVLAASDRSDPDDLFYVDDVLNAHLSRTALVVLSACATARRGSDAGAGSEAVARAFQIAGVPAVIGTQWAIDDDLARRFGVRFHRELSRGSLPAAALRLAQIDVMRRFGSRGLSWAAFAAFGASDLLKGEWQHGRHI